MKRKNNFPYKEIEYYLNQIIEINYLDNSTVQILSKAKAHDCLHVLDQIKKENEVKKINKLSDNIIEYLEEIIDINEECCNEKQKKTKEAAQECLLYV